MVRPSRLHRQAGRLHQNPSGQVIRDSHVAEFH